MMGRAKWMRSIEARARFAMSSSVIGLLYSSCDSHVQWADRRHNTHVDIEVQPLRVGVVRFDVVVIVHLVHDGVVLSQSSAMSSTYSRMVPMYERASGQSSMLMWLIRKM